MTSLHVRDGMQMRNYVASLALLVHARVNTARARALFARFAHRMHFALRITVRVCAHNILPGRGWFALIAHLKHATAGARARDTRTTQYSTNTRITPAEGREEREREEKKESRDEREGGLDVRR